MVHLNYELDVHLVESEYGEKGICLEFTDSVTFSTHAYIITDMNMAKDVANDILEKTENIEVVEGS